ncbi:unnamed protein product, partial [Urochloa humidicola]
GRAGTSPTRTSLATTITSIPFSFLHPSPFLVLDSSLAAARIPSAPGQGGRRRIPSALDRGGRRRIPSALGRSGRRRTPSTPGRGGGRKISSWQGQGPGRGDAGTLSGGQGEHVSGESREYPSARTPNRSFPATGHIRGCRPDPTSQDGVGCNVPSSPRPPPPPPPTCNLSGDNKMYIINLF